MAYAPALKNGYIWDDSSHVTENSLLRSVEGLKRIWFEPGAWHQYYPLVLSSFWIEYHLWGLNPFGYHLVNVLLHIFNAILLFYVLRGLDVQGAWMVAAIFALHPVHVESVAWISERKNVISGFFYLSSLLFYIRFILIDENLNLITAPPASPPPLPKKIVFRLFSRNYLLSMGLFICALLSKTVTCSLPAVLLLLLWWKKGKLTWQNLMDLVPMFIVGFALGINTVLMEKFTVGAKGAEWSFTIIDRFLIAGRALWFYGGKIIWPFPLMFIYPRWEIDSTVWWQYLFPLATFIIIAVLFIIRHRIGRGPLTAVLIFSGTLFPALGFVNLYPHLFSFVADHFQYLASISIIVLIFSSLATLINNYSKKVQAIGLVLFLSLIIFYALLTWKQTHIYKNSIVLYEDTIAKNPECWMANYNIAFHFEEQGRMQDAIGHYLETIRIKPNYVQAYYNLGNIFHHQGRSREAIQYYSEAIRIEPNLASAHNNLGEIYYEQGRLQEATDSFLEAIRIKPDLVETLNNLGNIFIRQRRAQEAIKYYLEAIRLKPDFADAHNNLGIAYIFQGNTNGAITCFQEALRIKPDFVSAEKNLQRALMIER